VSSSWSALLCNISIPRFILQSVHLLYKYAMRIIFCFIRTRRINFSYYTNKLFSLRINFPLPFLLLLFLTVIVLSFLFWLPIWYLQISSSSSSKYVVLTVLLITNLYEKKWENQQNIFSNQNILCSSTLKKSCWWGSHV
jgi:hypothetical protein